MGVQWTQEQKKVIELRDRNILVSAAAGSGKTAVLVERIIQKLLDMAHPMDVDRLLIVTFTEAAAAEMKERIRDAIEKALEEQPENAHLQRQATLIHSAQITTIHSFCLSVIREHFHVIDLDPGFRIAEEGELKLLRQDVLEDLLEEAYASQNEKFLEFSEKFGTGRSDKKLEELILTLYDYSLSYPQKEQWLLECIQAYTNIEENLEEQQSIKLAKCFIWQKLMDSKELIKKAIQVCEEPDGPYFYADALESDLKWIESFKESDSFQMLYEKLSKPVWKRLSAKKDETISDEKKNQVKKQRDKVKDFIKDIQATCLFEEPNELAKDMKMSGVSMEVLVALVLEFGNRFSEKKKSKNIIDFNDMEQFALQILTEEVDGKLVPSISAKEYQDQFEEVMIDEYQDSNLIQEAILTSVSTIQRGKNNVFMVGDVKQSIYRFRLSRPELFMDKYEHYSQEDAIEQRIDLHKNFRSRNEVLESTNYIFEQIMQRPVGGITYDKSVALYPGADYPESEIQEGKSANQTELLLLDTQEIGEESGRILEARMVAKRIANLVRHGKVVDKKTREYRRAEYRDIVILTRSIKGWADVFAQVLTEEGIPVYVGSREGYFETYEIQVLMDYLRILDNKQQDLPLAAVLTSPFVGLTAEELAELKSTYPESRFYEAVWQYAKLEDAECKNSILFGKLRSFEEQIESFREMLPYLPMHELLWKIIEETGYGVYISAMPGGEQRMANIEMLVEKASSYETSSYKGLFHFVRYVEQLRKYDVDYGEANIADEQADMVRIMSIHKSKGLEFPIVFVCGMGKRFNMQDINSSMVIHPKLGVGIDAIDLNRRTKIPTLLKKMIQNEIKVENLGEELRVLYVAMTRAKEKLILTGVYDGVEERLEEYEGRKKAPLSMYEILGAKTYLDWILIAAMGEDSPIDIHIQSASGLEKLQQVEDFADNLAKDVLENWDTKQIYDERLSTYLTEQMNFQYPYREEGNLKTKFTVSDLKKRAYEDDEAEEFHVQREFEPIVPSFLSPKETLGGAARGSAYHRLLELLDFSKQYKIETLEETMAELENQGMLSTEMRACIRTKDIIEFLESKIGVRLHQAAKRNELYKEQPFVLGVNSKEIYPDIASQELILIQGIMDVYFEEDGEIILLDYKTDRVRTEEELRKRYEAQLEYYAQALEQLLGKKVKEKWIYSFTLKKEIGV